MFASRPEFYPQSQAHSLFAKSKHAIAILILCGVTSFAQAQDATAKKIVEIGTQDPQVMTWLDVLTNRFGGRMAGSDNFSHAARWTRDQMRAWGIAAELEEAAQQPLGFNRGPWFGKMITPSEKSLRFGTPSYTAGTKGVQRGLAVLGPANEAEAQARMAEFKGAWVLIPGDSRGMGRDGRKEYKPDAVSLKLMEAGALGTIQAGKEPLALLDAKPTSWEALPTMPDIKMTADHYNEIQALLKKGEKVELEFDIRNWFYPGPVPYHNVVAKITGTEKPDEYVVIGAHLDSFDSATGAVDDGSGVSPTIEAMRLLAKAGAKPKRSIVMVASAGEELGIVGASAYTERHAKEMDKVVMMLNRDGAPGAVSGITVPSAWKAPFERVAKSLNGVNGGNPEFGFEVKTSDYPRIRAEALAGTDASAFSMKGVPTPNANNKTDFVYSRTWHTLLDTYNEVVPYAKAQQHSAIAIALMAYEAANAPENLSREGFYLPAGLYVEVVTAQGNVLVELQSNAAPATVARLIGQLETNYKPATFNPGAPRPTTPPAAIGNITQQEGQWLMSLNGNWPDTTMTETLTPTAVSNTKQTPVFAINAQGKMLLATDASKVPNEFPIIGKLTAGQDSVAKLGAAEDIRQVRVIRVGAEAKAFVGEGQKK
ncbi:M20/M25/M40 family metallo-hydrolase [Undibacterium cyanobacteriorum]|uniref:Carboxypeptidase Q n=1 Tax=Undibacterium cyanobacteriorum TaxID=3073561 RepID=A0ABY9RHE9_9BURK|nr:M20/M25/M40 family metallo-hydrolase [Undibacterium sp. 20NA77.5]WMW80646.1 M20/M25/M40 family metallo-hydrolase [Undibacterium sp. 20NA77.5]